MANYSILDLVPITEGSDATTALERSKELAILADELGFTRYWVAEHHNMPGIASSATSVVIGHLAAATKRIRVGSGGIMLPKSRGRHDVEQLDSMMSALEQENGIEPGSTPVIALVTETAAAMFTTGDYGGLQRLAAMTWGAEDLADSIGAGTNRNADGSYGFTYELARSLCLLGAAAAEVAAIETIQGDYRDLDSLKARAAKARRDGFRGMLAIHPAQVEVINAAFTPTAEEIAEAQAIVDLFAANPGVGTIGYQGGMLDRPHLSRAQQLLRQV